MMRQLGRATTRIRHLLFESMGREQFLFSVGVASLALAFVVIFVPWAVPERTVKPLVSWFADPTTITLLAGAAGLLGLWSVRGDVTEESEPVWRPARDPETAYFDEHRISGSDVDDGLELMGNLQLSPRDRRLRRRRTRRHVREAAFQLLREEGYDEADAKRSLKDGSWTNDPRAAAFLGAPNADVPLRNRVVDWARGETFDRRAEHAIAELEARTGGNR